MKRNFMLSTKVIQWLIIGSTVIGLSACGSGGSENMPSKVATGYYIDSAVAGVNYKCGVQQGITGADGSFKFEVDSSCTFSLGDIKLREVGVDLLKDGEEVIEKDINIGLILQNLDTDGNPENGITIPSNVMEILHEQGVTVLPTALAQAEALGIQIAYALGHDPITYAEAQAHMNKIGATINQMPIPTPIPTPTPTPTPIPTPLQ